MKKKKKPDPKPAPVAIVQAAIPEPEPTPVKVWVDPVVTARHVVPVEDLRAGDVVEVEPLGPTTIVAVKPFQNAVPGLFATVDTVPGLGFALIHGTTMVRCDVRDP